MALVATSVVVAMCLNCCNCEFECVFSRMIACEVIRIPSM